MKAARIVLLIFTQICSFGQQMDSVENDKTQPGNATAEIPRRKSFLDVLSPYRAPHAPPLRLGPADRAQALVRDGRIYVSLYDALALAIENNLDVEISRYNLSVAGTEILRASGGGDLRGIDYSVAESPTGVGGPGSPLLNSAASTITPSTPTVNDLTSLNILTETQSNLSVKVSRLLPQALRFLPFSQRSSVKTPGFSDRTALC